MADKETQFEKIKRISKKQDHIRNIATSAHIHHGKTALTDNLLAASGYMAAKSAGSLDEGMATWQHADEQERLMTVDSANVSMVHDFHGEEYLINLIDTPGHVDFSGNVTRAMRAIDGVIILVCAVEGVMPQTETVIRQAIKERVHPILFINKVDRLINELQVTPEQMQQRLSNIVNEVNEKIRKLLPPELREKWALKVETGNVIFGSAFNNWAITVPYMKKTGINFKTIYDHCKNQDQKSLSKKAPLHEVLLEEVISHLPNPLEAQKLRIPVIWHGDLEYTV